MRTGSGEDEIGGGGLRRLHASRPGDKWDLERWEGDHMSTGRVIPGQGDHGLVRGDHAYVTWDM